jgi:cytochrome c-type biogenesis protein CcmE
MNKNLKFGLLAGIILGALAFLAYGGAKDTATYYKEIAEIQKMGNDGVDKRLRVGGDIKANSIIRDGGKVRFTLIQKDKTLDVVYTGADPLPDTFKDGSQAVADGKLASDGVFHATKVQAKCASKYEAKPTGAITRG